MTCFLRLGSAGGRVRAWQQGAVASRGGEGLPEQVTREQRPELGEAGSPPQPNLHFQVRINILFPWLVNLLM